MTEPTAPSLKQTLSRSLIGLLSFALLTAGTVSVTLWLTADQIEENRRLAAARWLHELAPPDRYDIDLDHPLLLPAAPQLGHQQPFAAHLAWQNGEPALWLLPVIASGGYTGDIHLLVALNLKGQLAGVRVVEHRETPGLGDKIETAKSDWIHTFAGRSLTDPSPENWAVRRDGGVFDQFTGATITPRAIVNSLKQTLLWQVDALDELNRIATSETHRLEHSQDE